MARPGIESSLPGLVACAQATVSLPDLLVSLKSFNFLCKLIVKHTMDFVTHSFKKQWLVEEYQIWCGSYAASGLPIWPFGNQILKFWLFFNTFGCFWK